MLEVVVELKVEIKARVLEVREDLDRAKISKWTTAMVKVKEAIIVVEGEILAEEGEAGGIGDPLRINVMAFRLDVGTVWAFGVSECPRACFRISQRPTSLAIFGNHLPHRYPCVCLLWCFISAILYAISNF
jgi:hypothetical protein